ncbi:MAG TPA: preprotein translocase subunit SecE [Candidatus Acidoferrales bacterium]|nr:preprotein translocase subunit SecE [Candidatus Acidoferrales bacterium]
MNNEETRAGESFSVPGPISKIAAYPKRLKQFLHETRVEMKQVNWPSWPDVWSQTVVVTVTVAFFGVFFYVTDSVLTRASAWVLGYFK